MKKVFIYYSLTGNGDEIAKILENKKYDIRKVETNEILPKNFILRILTGGYKAMIKYEDKLIDFDSDIEDYDEIIIGSPIWNNRLSSPINTVLKELKLNNKKITFYYLTYNLDKELEKKYGGQVYVVSPYGMAWNNDKYYIVGVQEKKHADGSTEIMGTKTFRIDRMDDVKVKDEARRELPEAKGDEDFDMAKFCERCVSMYSGREMEVRLRLPNYLMDTAIDQFGEKFWVLNKDEQNGTFEMNAIVSFSKTFVGWLAGFGGQIQLLSPQEAIDEMKLQLTNVLNAHK